MFRHAGRLARGQRRDLGLRFRLRLRLRLRLGKRGPLGETWLRLGFRLRFRLGFQVASAIRCRFRRAARPRHPVPTAQARARLQASGSSSRERTAGSTSGSSPAALLTFRRIVLLVRPEELRHLVGASSRLRRRAPRQQFHVPRRRRSLRLGRLLASPTQRIPRLLGAGSASGSCSSTTSRSGSGSGSGGGSDSASGSGSCSAARAGRSGGATTVSLLRRQPGNALGLTLLPVVETPARGTRCRRCGDALRRELDQGDEHPGHRHHENDHYGAKVCEAGADRCRRTRRQASSAKPKPTGPGA